MGGPFIRGWKSRLQPAYILYISPHLIRLLNLFFVSLLWCPIVWGEIQTKASTQRYNNFLVPPNKTYDNVTII